MKRTGLPCIVALNMSDLASQRGLNIDTDALSQELGLPVVKTVAVNTGVIRHCASVYLENLGINYRQQYLLINTNILMMATKWRLTTWL